MPTPFVFETNCDSSIIAALSGLVGAVVGASIGAIATWRAGIRQGKAKLAQEKRSSDVALKKAARLVHLEFLRGLSLVRSMKANKNWTQIPVSSEFWQQYCPILASELLDSDWVEVSVAGIALEHLLALKTSAGDRRQVVSTEVTLDSVSESLQSGSETLSKWFKEQSVR